MSAATFWMNDCNRTSENSSAVGNLRSTPCNPPMLSNSNCRRTTTINDWLRQHHQQQQQQSGSQSPSQTTVPSLDVLFIKSDPTDGSQFSSTVTGLPLDVDDQLAELTESERDYQMDLNAAIVAAASSTAIGVVDVSLAPVASSMDDRHQWSNQPPAASPAPAAAMFREQRSSFGQRWTAYDNVDQEECARKNIDKHHSPTDDNHDCHIEEILRQCTEYDQRTSATQSKSQSGKQSADDVTIIHQSALPLSLSTAKNMSDTSTSLRLELPHHQIGSRSPRTSPSFNTSAATGSTSPSTSMSSKIKTNGSLTSPIHGRRAVAMGTSPPESSPSNTENATTAAVSDVSAAATDVFVPCWLETTTTKMHPENRTTYTSRSEFIAAEEYCIDSYRRRWPGAADSDNDDDGDDEMPSADWSEDGIDDVEDDVIRGYDGPSQRMFSTQSQCKVTDNEEVSSTAMARMSHSLTSTTKSIERRNKDQQTSENQLSVLNRRMKDIEDLEENAIKEVMAELEVVDDVMTSEFNEVDEINHRLGVIKQQQMELLLEAAKEREDADCQMATERRRLRSMERICHETSERLRSRDRNFGNADEDETVDEVELRMALRRQQDAIDCQKRRIDDLEFQLLEMETRREGEREPFQKKLMAERSKLLQTCSLRKTSLQSLYLQKLELLSQAKTDVADLGKEYQLLVDACTQEQQKLNDIKENSDNDDHNEVVEETTSGNHGDHSKSLSDRMQNDCTSSLSWKQGILWRTLMELEAHIVSDKPRSAEDGEDDGQRTADDDDNSRRTPRSRDWYGESEKSSDDVSCGGLYRDRDTEISSSGNTLDELDDYVGSGSLRSNVEVSDGDHSMMMTADNCLTSGSVNNMAGYDDTWSHLSESADCISDHINGTATAASNTVAHSNRIVYRNKRSANRQSRPMTRYLPVRDGSGEGSVSCTPSPFNLRQFIESSGHVVDDGPDSQCQVTPVACHGWLVKMAGHKRLHVWHRRYFLFDRTWRTLSWYPSRVNPSTVAPPSKISGGRCCVPFGSIVDVFVDHLQKAGRSPSQALTFCIKTRDRCIYVVAPSAEVMRIWIDVLVTGAEGYGEFR